MRTGAPPEVCRGIRGAFSYERAVRAQKALRLKVTLRWPGDDVLSRAIMALDASYWGPQESYGVAVAVAFTPEGEPLACYESRGPVCVPYVPGLLAFREMQLMAPAAIALMTRYRVGLTLVDGHGIAHPRRFGIASHVGVALGVPSIGVAKRLLYGRLEQCDLGLCIASDEGVLGVAIETPRGRIYVSPGNLVDVRKSLELVRPMLRSGLALPYPLGVADRLSKLERSRLTTTRPNSVTVHSCDDKLKEVVKRL